MKVVIIEDELAAARRLEDLIREIRPHYEIVQTLQSIRESVTWFAKNPGSDLLFMDIQLADGLSFNIFTQVDIIHPIIFTTAYDQYALKAFKVNSIDYLLKPIDELELIKALEKYEARQQTITPLSPEVAQVLLQSLHSGSYKSRFLVKSGKIIRYLNSDDIRYFYSEDGITFAKDATGHRHMLDATIEQIESSLDPRQFFRINRKIILHIKAVQSVQPHLNSRLAIKCVPDPAFSVIVARERAQAFKKWLDE